MPQFDTFTLPSTLFYFIICFALLLTYNFTHLLPRLSAILKLRNKMFVHTNSEFVQTKSNDDKVNVFLPNISDDNK